MKLWQAALAIAVLGSGTACERRAPPWQPGTPRHVFLISIDTLRADRCGCYGYDKDTTPFLDSLAREGVVFEKHYASSNNTLVSHASMLTGLVPAAHDTRSGRGRQPDRKKLSSACETVAERFQESGFATASFTAHPAWLGDRFGLDQGFDRLDTDWRDAREVTRAFLRWLDGAQPQRMFAFLHYYDVHSEHSGRGGQLPYDSGPEWVERFAPARPEGFTGALRSDPEVRCSSFLRAVHEGREVLPGEHIEYLSDLYDAGVAKMDAELAHLFAELRKRGLLEHSLFVITSDHGEEFFEHGGLLHDGWHDEVQHVPLVFSLPYDMRRGGARISAITSSVDLAPTLLESVGLAGLGQGRSLLPAIVGAGELADGEAVFNSAILRSRDEASSFLFGLHHDPPFFYDLDADPGETANLAQREGFADDERIRTIRTSFESHRAAWQKIAEALRAKGEGSTIVSDDNVADLRELGYVD